MEEPIRDGILDILTKKRKLTANSKTLYEMVKKRLKGSLQDLQRSSSNKSKHGDNRIEEEEEEEVEECPLISEKVKECLVVNASDPYDLMCTNTAPGCNMWWIVLKEIKTGHVNIRHELSFQKNPLDVMPYNTLQNTQTVQPQATNKNTRAKRRPGPSYVGKQTHKVIMVSGPLEYKHKLDKIETRSDGIKFIYDFARRHKKKIYR